MLLDLASLEIERGIGDFLGSVNDHTSESVEDTNSDQEDYLEIIQEETDNNGKLFIGEAKIDKNWNKMDKNFYHLEVYSQ